MRSIAAAAVAVSVALAARVAGAWDGPFEKAGPNLCEEGCFEGQSLAQAWKWNDNGGGFAVRKAPGHRGEGGGLPEAAALVSTRTGGRGKFWTKGFRVPAGADVRVSLWAKAQEHLGGTWVNLEGEPGEGFSKFDIAGGTYDWTQYVHRTTIPLKKFRRGRMVRLELWFYVYGRGTLLLDDVECRVIEPDPAAEAAWAERRTRGIVRSAASWKGRKPRDLGSFASKAEGPDALRRLDATVSACARAASGSRSWGVLVTDPVHRVFRELPFREDFSTAVEIDTARHEFEGAQLLLFSYEEDLKAVSVAVGDLEGPGTIDAKNVQVLPVAYGDRSKAPPIRWYQGRTSRHWPDPLLPNRRFTVERGTVQPVYLRFYCPLDTKAGTYRGSVEIETSAGSAEVPVLLEVHDVTMPVRLHIKSMCVGGRSEKPYLDLSLEQRMPIGNIAVGMSWARPTLPAKGNSFDFSEVERKLTYCIDRGMNAFIMASTPKSGKWGFPKGYSAGWKANMSKVIREYGGWLKRKGWLDMAYYNNIDEPGRGRWGQCKELYRMAKAANPDVKVFHCVNTLGALDAMKGCADTWDVYIQQADQQQAASSGQRRRPDQAAASGQRRRPDQAAARSREGAEIWWAVCVWPKEHPNLFVEYPLMDARIIGWAAFEYNVAGFEYWQMTSWDGAWRNRGGKAPKDGSWATCPAGVLTTAWPYDRGRSGDGYLCYPGDGALPVNSLRFEALRDGLEDFELLYQLRQRLPALSGKAKAEAAKLLEGSDGLVTNMFLYSSDPARLLAARKRVFHLASKRTPRH